jgi:putative protein-disulfide isomerase
MEDNARESIDITLFTDPLCCWSWAFEAELQQLKALLEGNATWTIKMGGLIPSWDNYHDTVNSVSRPSQMGPVWMHAGQIAGKPICHQVWMKDPPASSYPACIAVKCAALQSSAAGESMLYLLQEQCMIMGKNIAKQEILFSAAQTLAHRDPSFDFDLFKEDFFSGKGLEAFRSDLHLLATYRINRFPALVIKIPGSKPMVMSGFRNHQEVLKVIESVAAGIS